MNEFVSWCRHLLVSFLFHVLTSLHPPSFHRNDFSTCSTHFSLILVQSPALVTLALNGRVDNYCYTQCVAMMYLSLLSSSVR